MRPEGEGQIGILARKARQAPPIPELGVDFPPEKSFLIFANQEGIGSSLAERLRGPVFVVELFSVKPHSQRNIPISSR